MRTLTLARMGRALLLAAAVIMLPQIASAQLPIETQTLRLQGATSGSVNLNVPATGGTGYTITLPAAVGGAGAFLYASNGTGTLAWTDMTSVVAGWYPTWDGTAVVWTDPAGAANPNWSRTGNNVAAGTYKLGTTGAVDANINVVTRDVTRMSFSGTTVGTISVTAPIDINVGASTDAVNIASGTGAATVSIGNSAATLTTAGTLGHTGAANITGATTVNTSLALGTTAATPLLMNADAGADGEVLVSKGASATPEWQNLNEAIGIRKAGRVPTGGTLAVPTAATSVNVTGVILQSTDAIIVTVDGGGAAVVPNVSSRTHSTGAATTDGAFTVTLSSSYAGAINYMIIRNQ